MTRGQCGSLDLHWERLALSTPCRSPGARLVTETVAGRSGARETRCHTAATALCHRAVASARKALSVDREMRWRCRLNVLWTAAWTLRKRWADRADLNLCILRSRRRTA